MDATASQHVKQLHNQPAPLLLTARLSGNRIALLRLPGFAVLATAGVRRLGMGPFLFEALAGRQLQLNKQIRQEQVFTSLFA